MPLIISIVVIMFLVLIGWTWNNLGTIEKNKKILYIIIGIAIVYVITLIIYNISKSGINYESEKVMKTIQRVLTIIFSIVNGYALLPYFFKKLDQLENKEIKKKELKKSIVMLVIIVIVLLIFESNYLATTQKGILQMLNKAR